MKYPMRTSLLAGAALALAGCGATEDGAEPAGSDSAEASALAAPAAPGLAGRQAIVADFQAASPGNCPFYKEASQGTDDGDFAGATLTLCTGRFSQTENFSIAIMNEDGENFPAGTAFVTMGANSAPGAFAPLYDVIYDLAGITDTYEKEQLRSEIARWLFGAANIRTIDWEPVMTTQSGVRIRAATYKFGTGPMPTFRIDPPR